MVLYERLLKNIYIQERSWSWRLFLLLICAYFISILLVSLPNGSSTYLTVYGMSNPECNKTNADPDVTKKCNPILRITANSTAKEYLTFFGGGDPGSYARGGMMLAGQEGDLPKDYTTRLFNLQFIDRLKLMNLLGFGTFPPGMYFLNTIPLQFNAEAPLGLYQVVVASTLWAVAFALIVSLLVQRVRFWIAALLPFLIMLFPLFHDYFFRYGVMYSETHAAAIMVIGFTLLFQGLYRKPNISLMIIAGLFFAGASLLRAQSYHIAIGVSVILMGCYLLLLIRRYLIIKNFSKNPSFLGKLMVIGAFLIGFYMPIASYLYINGGKLLEIGFLYTYPFITPPYPEAGVANFIALGGVRTACEVDLLKCEENRKKITNHELSHNDAKKEIFKAFISHPLNFAAHKLPIAWKYWMVSSDRSPAPVIEISYSAESVILLLLFMACLWFTIIRRLWWLFLIGISTCGLIFAAPFLIEFQVRYFFLMKAFVIFWPLWLLLIYTENKEK